MTTNSKQGHDSENENRQCADEIMYDLDEKALGQSGDGESLKDADDDGAFSGDSQVDDLLAEEALRTGCCTPAARRSRAPSEGQVELRSGTTLGTPDPHMRPEGDQGS